MNKICFLAICFILAACDDGEFNVPSFEFDGLNINNCGTNGTIVFSKITSSGTESLVLQLDENNTDNEFFNTPLNSSLYKIGPSQNNKMYYKIFNDNISTNYYCQEIPPSSPIVTKEWLGEGDLNITNTVSYDDNDGVPKEDEDINGNGNYEDDDTDGDGYPNYRDIDDDGDNKLTKDETTDVSSFPITTNNNPQNIDTDGDGIPNYLDEDDDGDGTLSVFESEVADENGNTIVDYLDSSSVQKIDAGTPAINTYFVNYIMVFQFQSLTLSNDTNTINYRDGYTYGTKSGQNESTDLSIDTGSTDNN